MNNTELQYLKDMAYAETDSSLTFRNYKLNSGRAVISKTVAGLLFLFLACSVPANSAGSRLNLPQLRQQVRLDEGARAAVRNYFSHQRAAGELPAALQASLLQNLPLDFENACEEIVKQWSATGTKYWRVRILDHQGAQAWLAFRCGLPGQGTEHLYDERLALVRMDTSTLELLPLGPDTGDDDVYHIEFVKPLVLKNAEGFAFQVATKNNPCCDGPESRSQERLVVFSDTPHGTLESLSVVTSRDDMSHCDDPEVDTETTRHANVKFERETKNLENAVSVTFREKVTDIHWESGKPDPHTVSDHSGTLHFRWNSVTFKFERTQ